MYLQEQTLYLTDDGFFSLCFNNPICIQILNSQDKFTQISQSNLSFFQSNSSCCESYPVHAEKDARSSLRISVVGVPQARAVPQPGPLKLAGFPLLLFIQAVLHEVSLLCAADVLPLLNAIVVR